jgi:hypothetical protein
VVEISAGVHRNGHATVVRTVFQQEELDLGVGVEGETLLRGLRQRPAQLALPSGSRMSQNIRALSPDAPPSNGKTWKVVGSGMATMSDS